MVPLSTLAGVYAGVKGWPLGAGPLSFQGKEFMPESGLVSSGIGEALHQGGFQRGASPMPSGSIILAPTPSTRAPW